MALPPPDDMPPEEPAASPPDAAALTAVILGVESIVLPLLMPVIMMTGPFVFVFAPLIGLAQLFVLVATVIAALIGAQRGISRPMALTGLFLALLGGALSAFALTHAALMTLLVTYWVRLTLGL